MLPSETTSSYWVFAESPTRDATAGYTGKWLVFVPTSDIDAWWTRIEQATRAGKLGFKAKAATARPNPNEQNPRVKVICVYTRDWRDVTDVVRVLAVLRDLGIDWRLAYKTDATTLAGRYGNGVSQYVSDPDSLAVRAPAQR